MKTSFGEMEILAKEDERPHIEYLKFEREGRSHKHSAFESFFVLRGSGKVYVDENVFDVAPGSQVLIPPNSAHWMKPNEGSVMEGLLWYHSDPITLHC